MKDRTRYDCEQSIARADRAYRYMMGTLDDSDAAYVIHDCLFIARWYPLETLSEESVLERLCEEYEEAPELGGLVQAACRRVWSKWSSTGDTAYAAENWALDLVKEYAKQDGVEFKPTEDASEIETAIATGDAHG